MRINFRGKQYQVSFKKRIIPVAIKEIVPDFSKQKPTCSLGNKLCGKTVVVTGGTRGIGLAIVTACAREGANVYFTGRTTLSVENTLNSLKFRNVRGGIFNVSECDDIKHFLDDIKQKFGRIDVLVNNAGVNTDSNGIIAHFEDIKNDGLHYIHDINVIGTREMCEVFVKMEQKKSCILNIISNTALRPSQECYFLSKRAIYSYTEALAASCKEKGIAVNGICPGRTKTDMMYKAGGTIVRDSINCRLGLPEEIAELAVTVIVSGLSGLTGRVFTCDGGELLF